MKKSFLLGIASMMLLASCGGHDNAASETTPSDSDAIIANATREELVTAVQERDQLLGLINEIITDMNEIKSLENIVTINAASGELADSTTTAIANNISAIKATLQERQNRIASLESQLKNSKTSNNQLLSTIEALKSQISNQAAEIESLTAKLNLANEKIDELNRNVNDVTMQRDLYEAEANRQKNLANVCYYCIGSKKELLEHGILQEGGFMKKDKLMQGDFDQSFFTKTDKRTVQTIPLHSKKAKVLTTYQPAGSYEIIDVNGQKVLRILNPQEFWSVSNYLVIQTD